MSKWQRIKKQFHDHDKKAVLTNAFALGLAAGAVFSIIMIPVTVQIHSAALAFSAFLGGPMAFAIMFTLTSLLGYLAMSAAEVLSGVSHEDMISASTNALNQGVSLSKDFANTVSNNASDYYTQLTKNKPADGPSDLSSDRQSDFLTQSYRTLCNIPSMLFWNQPSSSQADSTELRDMTRSAEGAKPSQDMGKN